MNTELLAADLELPGVIPLFSCGPLVLALAAWIGIFWVADQESYHQPRREDQAGRKPVHLA